MTKARRFEDLEGRQDEGFVYRKVDLDTRLPGLGRRPRSPSRTQTRPGGAPNVIFWFGIRNLELNDYGESLAAEKNPLHVNAFLAIVANTIGWLLIIPPFVSQWRYYRRIGRAQELAGMDHRISAESAM
jgi:hypothetical protein